MFGFLRKKKHATKEEPITEIKNGNESSLSKENTETETVKKERKLSYHITKHPNGGWQLKKGKADRALKLFKTQKEAIDYANQLEKERGISYLIHKTDGSNRKKKY